MFSSNCCFLTSIQISHEAGQVVWHSYLFQNFPSLLWSTQSKALAQLINRCFYRTLLVFWWSNRCWEFDLWFLCLFLIQLKHLEVHGSYTFEAWLGEFWALLYKRVRWVQLCSSLSILWHCLSLGLEWKLTFSCGHCWVFQICWHIECSTFTAFSFRIWNSSTGIPSPPLALFVVMPPKAHLTSYSSMSGSRLVITSPWSVRTGHGTTNWFQIGKGVCQGCTLSTCLFNLYVEYIMRNAGLDEAQAGIKIAGRNINNRRSIDDTTLMEENKEELRRLLMKEKGKWKSWLKTQRS